jgi:predicted PurR-regulated permease PerM
VQTAPPGPTLGRTLPAVILAAVWLVFLARGLHDLLIPPIAALVLVFLLFPHRQSAWASRTMIAAGALATLWILAKVQTILWIAGLGLFTAYVLNPAVVRLERLGIQRSRAALYLVLASFAGLVTAAVIVLPDLYSQASSLVSNLPGYQEQHQEQYRGTLADPRLREFPVDLGQVASSLTARIESILSGAGTGLAALARRTGATLSILVLSPIVGYNLLKDLPAINAGLLALLPRAAEHEVADIQQEMDLLIGRWLRGQLIVSLIVGTLTAIGLSILGIRYSIAIGAVAGLLNMVPIIGYWISLALAVIVALTGAEPLTTALIVLAIFFGIQILEQNFISPRVVGQETGLHPVAILLSLLVFSALAGFAGALFAIPFTLFLRVFFRRYIAGRLREARFPSS